MGSEHATPPNPPPRPLAKHVRKSSIPAKSETKSYSIFHSSTCYECVLFNKEDHLPQNSRLLTSLVFAAIQGLTAAHCFNLDRHLVIMFSTTPLTLTSTSTHTFMCVEADYRNVSISRMSMHDLRYFMVRCGLLNCRVFLCV